MTIRAYSICLYSVCDGTGILMEKKQTKRELKRIESDKRILDATIKIVGEKGYTNANFKEIAKEAGITPGLITQRFETKEKLVARAIHHADTIWRADKLTMDIPIEEMLKSSINKIKQDYIENEATFRFTYTVCSGTDIPKSIKEMNEDFFYRSGTYRTMRKGQEKGYFPKGDLASLYNIFIVNTCRLVMDYSQDGMTMPDNEYFMKLIQYRDPEAEEQQTLRNKAFEAMSKSFFSLVYCNVPTGTYRIARTLDRIKACSLDTDDAQEFLYKACDEMVDTNWVGSVKAFLDLSTVMDRIGNKKVIVTDFESYNHKNHRLSFIAVSKEKGNEIVLCGVQEIENNTL